MTVPPARRAREITAMLLQIRKTRPVATQEIAAIRATLGRVGTRDRWDKEDMEDRRGRKRATAMRVVPSQHQREAECHLSP